MYTTGQSVYLQGVMSENPPLLLGALAPLENDRLLQLLTEQTKTLNQSKTLLYEVKVQIMGGTWVPADPGHPGHLLLAMGWTYSGPETEFELDEFLEDPADLSAIYCWEDPQTPPGRREAMTLPAALARAFERYWRLPSRLSLTDGLEEE